MRPALYVVVRADLPAGLQMAQLGHAAHTFGLKCALADVGDTIVVLNAPDERALAGLVRDAAHAGAALVTIHEPDLGGELTAAAFSSAAARVVRKLPLAGAQPPGAAAS